MVAAEKSAASVRTLCTIAPADKTVRGFLNSNKPNMNNNATIHRILAILLPLAIAMASCNTEQCAPNDKIDGVWKQTFSPHSIYSFSDGICIQRVYAAGEEVWRNEYTYTFSADLVYLTDIVTGEKRTWVVSFKDDNTLTAYDANLAFVIALKRII